jgi:hypothetical protein
MSVICPRCDRVPASGVGAGSPCAACGEILIEDPLANLGDLNVVTLDVRAGAPPLAPPAPVQPPAAAPPEPITLAELAPQDDLLLEVDPAWTAARAVRQQAARRPPPRPPRRTAGVVVAVLLMAAAAVAIVVLVWR